MKRSLSSQLDNEDENEGKITATFDERGSPKKLKINITDRIKNVVDTLNERINKHKINKVETQDKIKEVCDILREAVDNMEKEFINTLQQSYTEEETRLQEPLEKLKTLCDEEEMSDEKKDEMLKEIESTLCGVQKYRLSHPNFENVSKWAKETLNTMFSMSVEQSLSDEIIKGRIPHITELKETGSNEVCVGLEFLNEYEEIAMNRMTQWKGIE